MKKRLLAGIVSLAMVFGLMPSTALADNVENSQIAEQLAQTATELDENYTSDVSLSFPSDGYRRPLDVVFVLDGSTSTDKKDLAGAAAGMLEGLADIDKLDVQAGVVIFGGSVPILDFTQELLDLSEEGNLSDLKTMLTDGRYDGMTGRSGSNLQAGIEKARDLLNADNDANTSKYIILLTDGGARMWINDQGQAVAQYPFADSWNTIEDFSYRHGVDYPYTYSEKVRAFSEVMAAGENGKIGRYAITEAEISDENLVANYSQRETGEVLDVQTSPDYYTNLESATYFAAKSLQEIKNNQEASVIWVDYPYNAGTKYGDYTESFKSWLADNQYVTRYDTSSVADPADPFEKIKNNWIYFVDKGSTVDNTIGYGTDNNGKDYDFAMTNLDAMKLTFGGEELTAQKIEGEENKYGFGVQDENGTYQFELTYSPKDAANNQDEKFTLAINTTVTLEETVKLDYQVQLTNPQTVAGTYGTYDEDGSEEFESLRVSKQAVLNPVDSDGNSGTGLNFPLPTVSYTVQEIKVTPASLTIYMGGSSGYTNIVGEDGQTIQDTVSLPEPGFYLELPDSVNTELRQLLGKDENDVIDLSPYITLTADTGNGTHLSWHLERYGVGSEATESAGYIKEENRFIYKIVPDGSGAQVRVKVSSSTAGSDEFDVTNALFATYNMEIYGEGIEEGALTAKIQIQGAAGEPYKYNKTFSLKSGDPAQLTVRYVAGEQEDVVTPALDSIAEAHDSDKAYVVLQDLNGNAAEDFIINQAVTGDNNTTLTVQADPDSVALLFDDIVSADDTGNQQTHFEQALVKNAVAGTGQSFQNLRYQAKYLDLVEADNGNTWLTTNDKVTVYWPYPAGTNASTKFYLQHFDGIDRDDTLDAITSEVENSQPVTVDVHTDANGIYFETDSFSPYVLMWDEPTVTTTEEDDEEQPTATAQPTPAPTAAPAAAPTAAPAATVIPQTGDESEPIVWVMLMGVSALALVALAVYRKKRSSK